MSPASSTSAISAEDANTIIGIVGKAKIVGSTTTPESSDSKTAGQLAALDALTGKASSSTREAKGAKTRRGLQEVNHISEN
ncbi:hypothetical protein SAPIO_CDS8407 [Scedosporium apiospermum]|uniref:SMP domain-containing protein n=1 Tax=Pseudallescheria apiosperma TaxID=563466 RepID=A0A084FZJ7_PSEDA|nr:uncharacterized protein SAPIO_CDS8407 [Scedosporium apiospermum]KEZ40509.1 hypothetical protein SAPIO_CDS8407 [Scedosporium apiospermum]